MTSKTTVYPAKDGKKGSAGIDFGTGIRKYLNFAAKLSNYVGPPQVYRIGLNDPLWDLGDLSVEGEFNHSQDREIMQAYSGGRFERCKALMATPEFGEHLEAVEKG
jgi:hypothetical protein